MHDDIIVICNRYHFVRIILEIKAKKAYYVIVKFEIII